MAIEAPISKYKKSGLLIYIVVCLGASGWFAYDGYLNKNFIEKHTHEDGRPDSTLVFNQKIPPFGLGIAVLLVGYFFVIKNKKIVADETDLILSATEKIPYDSIQQIEKTHFESKGFFVLTYKDSSGKEIECKMNSRQYDNLPAVLAHLVEKIS